MASPMVVDLGSHAIKAGRSVGYPSDTEPSVVLPCTVQDSRVTVVEKLVHPMHAGVVTDWEGLETLLHYTLFEELGWAPEQEGQLLVADPVLSSRSDRERLCQLAFEGLGVRGLFVADQGVLSLYAAGKTSGLVVDYGLDKTGAVRTRGVSIVFTCGDGRPTCTRSTNLGAPSAPGVSISPMSYSGAVPCRLIAGLATAGCLETAYLTIARYTNAPVACPIGGGCATVLTSEWSTLFHTIPLSLAGSLSYGAWVTRGEYDEAGPGAVHMRCL
ncbi:hypothetical protein APUTEX25_003583 [Auxenochlorella protothecoides]|uniref:Vitamin K epoxide reductase domain-containing protein n=1 Tax=Auxenochlorella protothecoides TaxID=3075 RepID=A0A3M7KZW8_AUXPR|nr:hypothetical protein APUTEX25_003583 [Auxenochlorella protothecoides]|eukprot:RMZ55459.1 hypothetical protein APUTEX25_003583 [Auxenochlorella protothecoides]